MSRHLISRAVSSAALAFLLGAVHAGGAAAPVGKHGGCIDPDGKPMPCQQLVHGGCIDPNGKPVPCQQLELGGCIDPDGQPSPCQPTPEGGTPRHNLGCFDVR